MPKRKILVLDARADPWQDFLREFLEDTSSELDFFQDAGAAKAAFQKQGHDRVFIQPSLLSLAWRQALEARRATHAAFRVFAAGSPGAENAFRYDAVFAGTPVLADFQRELSVTLPLPEKVRILVVDDEPEIGAMIREFFERRVRPSFEVGHAPDGKQGLERVMASRPDVLILDVKMPHMDGREVYRQLRTRGLEVPTIVFFDAISGDEMTEIRKYGRPAVVEKGAPQSALPELMELVKKLAYFG